MIPPLLFAMAPPNLPLPTSRQLAWQSMETNAFVHFGPNTFTDVEWGGGKEDPNLFDPTALDCEQWVRTFKEAGFKGVIITAKHHDGFCLWPSKLSTHTVAQSKWRNGKGDVLKELSAACRKYGLKMGVYLSPWDRNHPTYGTPEYNKVFAGMLEEVLAHYGPIFEVWFDGANGEGPNGKKQQYDWDLFHRTVRKFQPNAVMFSDSGPDVRWVGNEEGFAGETCWGTIPSDRYQPGTPLYAELTEGRRSGDVWIPAECDVSIRPGWFYHADQDAKVRTPENLLDLYEKSVGRNSLLLLNVPPDRRGLINDADVAALKGFAALRARIYGNDLAKGVRMAGTGGTTIFTLPAPVTFDRIALAEPIKEGQRIASFTVEARDGGAWRPIARGTTVGHRRILLVPTATTDTLRVVIEDALAPAKLLPIGLYLAGSGSVERGELASAGKQAADGSLTIVPSGGSVELVDGGEAAWTFEGVRGEVRVEVDASGDAELAAEIGGQTLRGRIAMSGTTDLGRAAIVVGGTTTMKVRVSKGRAILRAVRLLPR